MAVDPQQPPSSADLPEGWSVVGAPGSSETSGAVAATPTFDPNAFRPTGVPARGRGTQLNIGDYQKAVDVATTPMVDTGYPVINSMTTPLSLAMIGAPGVASGTAALARSGAVAGAKAALGDTALPVAKIALTNGLLRTVAKVTGMPPALADRMTEILLGADALRSLKTSLGGSGAAGATAEAKAAAAAKTPITRPGTGTQFDISQMPPSANPTPWTARVPVAEPSPRAPITQTGTTVPPPVEPTQPWTTTVPGRAPAPQAPVTDTGSSVTLPPTPDRPWTATVPVSQPAAPPTRAAVTGTGATVTLPPSPDRPWTATIPVSQSAPVAPRAPGATGTGFQITPLPNTIRTAGAMTEAPAAGTAPAAPTSAATATAPTGTVTVKPSATGRTSVPSVAEIGKDLPGVAGKEVSAIKKIVEEQGYSYDQALDYVKQARRAGLSPGQMFQNLLDLIDANLVKSK